VRRLTSPPNPLTSTLAILDQRLGRSITTPLALGLSGGSDSVALAIMASTWAKSQDRALHLLTVDHQLSPDSGGWAQTCAALAARLGTIHHVLTWVGPKPLTGLPAMARQARHRLLATKAREIGAKVVLLGHTADDRAEGQLMRQDGSTTPDPREWSPSPVWPQGRGIFLLRPMLNLRRHDLRQWLTTQGETWIDDPANENLKYARARARKNLDPHASVRLWAEPQTDLADLAQQARFSWVLSLSRSRLREASLDAARTLTGNACLSVGGGSRPPRSERLAQLVDRLRGSDELIATLAGSRIEADAQTVRWMRNPGEFRRSVETSLELHPSLPAVWDGRFELTSETRATVVPLQGHLARLSPEAQRNLRTIPPGLRGALPLLLGEFPRCPVLELVPNLRIADLTYQRFLAACGVITSEAL
jgi:tRNA(Ile)-lysidine synthase